MYNLLEVNKALARAAATKDLIHLDKQNPLTWEFSGFSQNGEDGLLDYLIKQLKISDRDFLEIGSSNGVENNTAWLAVAKRFSGIMVEGSEEAVQKAKKFVDQFCIGVDVFNLWVNVENGKDLINKMSSLTPDIFSIDIDGNDYYITKSLMDLGLKPKIIIVEYNSAFGPLESKTIEYDKHMLIRNGKGMDFSEETRLYYGVSIKGWQNYFSSIGYRFVTVDSNGVNAVFMDPDHFDTDFVNQIKGINFQENFFQMRFFKTNWENQFEKIRHLDFLDI